MPQYYKFNMIDVPKDIWNTIVKFADFYSFDEYVLCKNMKCEYNCGQFLLHIKILAKKVPDTRLKDDINIFIRYRLKAIGGVFINIPLQKQIVFLMLNERFIPIDKLMSDNKVRFLYKHESIEYEISIEEAKLREMMYYAQQRKPAIGRKSVLLLIMMLNTAHYKRRFKIYEDMEEDQRTFTLCGETNYIENNMAERSIRMYFTKHLWDFSINLEVCIHIFFMEIYRKKVPTFVNTSQYIKYRGKKIKLICNNVVGIDEPDRRILFNIEYGKLSNAFFEYFTSLYDDR